MQHFFLVFLVCFKFSIKVNFYESKYFIVNYIYNVLSIWILFFLFIFKLLKFSIFNSWILKKENILKFNEKIFKYLEVKNPSQNKSLKYFFLWYKKYEMILNEIIKIILLT